MENPIRVESVKITEGQRLFLLLKFNQIGFATLCPETIFSPSRGINHSALCYHILTRQIMDQIQLPEGITRIDLASELADRMQSLVKG